MKHLTNTTRRKIKNKKCKENKNKKHIAKEK
jgi:hypothetical protein